MIVLVCGGRDYFDQNHVDKTLDDIHSSNKIDLIVHGNARGADTCAKNWARVRGIVEKPYPAQWEKFGVRAGILRNERMLQENKIDLIVAFPGGRGTADMKSRGRRSEIKIIEA